MDHHILNITGKPLNLNAYWRLKNKFPGSQFHSIDLDYLPSKPEEAILDLFNRISKKVSISALKYGYMLIPPKDVILALGVMALLHHSTGRFPEILPMKRNNITELPGDPIDLSRFIKSKSE